MLMNPPLGNLVGARRRSRHLFEGGPESTPRPMQSPARRDRETAHDACDLRRRQAFPLGQEENLPVARPEAAKRVVHGVLLPVG
jgi:hypothetical protein